MAFSLSKLIRGNSKFIEQRRSMNTKLREKVVESFSSVVPITLIVLVMAVLMVPMELGTFVMFLAGAILLIVGMGFFQLGAEMAMTPIGEGIGVELSKTKKTVIMLAVGMVMGFIITITEPDLQVLAQQVPSVPNRVLIFTIAIGVGVFLAISLARVRYKKNLSVILIVSYAILFGLTVFVPDSFLAVAFDSGGVTTGPMTVPFMMAMGIGFVSLRADKSSVDDSFGMVALGSIGPILMVLLLGIFYKPQEGAYEVLQAMQVSTTQDVAQAFLQGSWVYIKEMFMTLLPIVVVFIVFQLATHRFKHKQRARVMVGIVYTFIGLVMFLTGVNVGFLPVGHLLGDYISSSAFRWLLIPFGMLIGFFIVKAEPAVQVLNHQVEEITNGAVSGKAMSHCLSIGVAISVGLSMVRILTGISIMWILIPGYIIAITLTFFVPKIFIGIAFDSGGVASGPMTSTFLLPFAIGACEGAGGNVMSQAFGVVALVAMTPLIAVQIMGVAFNIKQRREDAAAVGIARQPSMAGISGDDEIIEYEEVEIDE